MRQIRIGSRDSKLAVVQSQLVMDAIRTHHPELELELVTMKTTGDKILDRTLDQIGGKGLFVKELDRALLEGRTDLSVHSCKDLPMEIPDALPLLGFSRREDPRDVLVLPQGVAELDPAKPIGCASARRKVQLKALFPGMDIQPVRGNVQTRLRKLDEGQFSALVLAAAGLKRLGLEGRVSRWFSTDEMIPAAGQGVLALQGRRGEDYGYLKEYLDPEAACCVEAERTFVTALDGGCSAPVAAYAALNGDALTLTGLYQRDDSQVLRDSITGDYREGKALATTLAARLLGGCQ